MGRGRNRGRRKRREEEQKKPENAPLDLSDEELDATLAEIASGSDRVAAILGAALVQNALRGSLTTYFEDKAETERVFDSLRGPLNSFYGQIVMGKALGLYAGELADGLHDIRAVRNKFAHAVHSINFDDEEIAKKCAKLAVLLPPANDEKTPSNNREWFERSCYVLTTKVIAAGTKNIEAGTKRRIAEIREKERASAINALFPAHKPGMTLSDLMNLVPASTEDGGKDA